MIENVLQANFAGKRLKYCKTT